MDTLRVLVAYGSTRGGTAGLAHMVADAFAGHHIRTEVRRAGDVRDVHGFDAVVVGGALYNNHWHPDAVTFVGRNREALRELPVWFFSSGPLDDSARSGALAPVAGVNVLAREVEIHGHMTFGGVLDRRPSGLMGIFAYGPAGDFRDRDQVVEWVGRIVHELLDGSTGMIRVVGSDGRARPHPTSAAVTPKPATVPAVSSEIDDVTAVEPMVVVLDDAAEAEAQAGSRPGRLRLGLRGYLSLDDDDETDDDGIDLFESADSL